MQIHQSLSKNCSCLFGHKETPPYSLFIGGEVHNKQELRGNNMKNIKQLVSENANIIYYNINQINFNCLVKLRTNLEGVNLKLNYRDLETIRDKNQNLLEDKIAGFMYYESGDEAYLINYDNILEVKFNKDGFKLLEIWNDLDTKINHIIKINLGFFDEDNKHVFDELRDLIEQKKQVLIALKIDYDK